MTLRAGSYDASRPRRRGVIRNDSYPWYACAHEHASFPEAKECAREALKIIRERDPENKGLHHHELPEGWRSFSREHHAGL
jgi:hypothetical protein